MHQDEAQKVMQDFEEANAEEQEDMIEDAKAKEAA